MMMKQILTAGSICALSVVFTTSDGHAGLKANRTVIVNSAARFAVGALGSVRNSANTVEFIQCTAYHYSLGAPYAVCAARDAANVNLTCESGVASIVAGVDSLSGDSELYFAADADGKCTVVRTMMSSYHPPKAL
jgi:hypothetical protein